MCVVLQKEKKVRAIGAFLGAFLPRCHNHLSCGSGGNALHTALSLCERVDVYGTGLFAAGATADKVYAHAYDERVGLCLEPGSRVYEFSNTKGLNGFFKWRRDRVRGELMMHLMHAVGIVRWVQ